jgi:hypothetical protein
LLDLLDKEKPEKNSTPVTQIPGNIQLLADIYKHHWDLFLKGYAFFLAACAVFASFVISKEASNSIFQKLFAGIAVMGASTFAVFGLGISYQFLDRIGRTIDELCEEVGFRKIYFDSPRKIVKLFKLSSIILFSAGFLYICHVLIYENGFQELKKIYDLRWK